MGKGQDRTSIIGESESGARALDQELSQSCFTPYLCSLGKHAATSSQSSRANGRLVNRWTICLSDVERLTLLPGGTMLSFVPMHPALNGEDANGSRLKRLGVVMSATLAPGMHPREGRGVTVVQRATCTRVNAHTVVVAWNQVSIHLLLIASQSRGGHYVTVKYSDISRTAVQLPGTR